MGSQLATRGLVFEILLLGLVNFVSLKLTVSTNAGQIRRLRSKSTRVAYSDYSSNPVCSFSMMEQVRLCARLAHEGLALSEPHSG